MNIITLKYHDNYLIESW